MKFLPKISWVILVRNDLNREVIYSFLWREDGGDAIGKMSLQVAQHGRFESHAKRW